MNSTSSSREWLETDGLGGFASGTAGLVRSRRYHALLLVATTPSAGRYVLVNGLEVWVETLEGTFPLSSQNYAPDIVHPDGARRIEGFGARPWPHWTFRLEDGTRVEQEVFAVHGEPITCVSWKIPGPRREVKLFARPLLSGRDYHALHKSNSCFRFGPEVNPNRVSWQPYDGVPGTTALTNGAYSHQPLWFYNFAYREERARGLDWEEDLAAPGMFSWDLAEGSAALVLTTKEHAAGAFSSAVKPAELLNKLRKQEKVRRERISSPLDGSADNYIVRRQQPPDSALRTAGKTIIAGYPWFTDWGRDTFIALRGLCLATGRLADAREILLAWTGAVSDGMLPNRFPDQGEKPEYNSVDASLWFIIAAYEYLCATEAKSVFSSHEKGPPLPYSLSSRGGEMKFGGLNTCDAARKSAADKAKLLGAMNAIVAGYSGGTRFGIRADDDGLLAAGVPGVQLTWMDAKMGDWVVTPRIGKPVEIQALWLNALWIVNQFNNRWEALFEQGMRSFPARFWNEQRSYLYDVVDVNHQRGVVDEALRPNQVFAVGGLPLALLKGEQARWVLEAIEAQLWTPLGLRSLAPSEPGYAAHYCGGVRQRDGSYHQGTVWPWLIGPFVEAWVRLRGGTDTAKREARKRFLQPLLQHLDEAGIHHISEIADGEPPHTPRGCPFQAWSLGEVLRLDRVILAVQDNSKRVTRSKRDLVLERDLKAI